MARPYLPPPGAGRPGESPKTKAENDSGFRRNDELKPRGLWNSPRACQCLVLQGTTTGGGRAQGPPLQTLLPDWLHTPNHESGLFHAAFPSGCPTLKGGVNFEPRLPGLRVKTRGISANQGVWNTDILAKRHQYMPDRSGISPAPDTPPTSRGRISRAVGVVIALAAVKNETMKTK